MRGFGVYLIISIKSRLFYRTSLIFNMLSPLVVLCGQLLLWNGLYEIGDAGDYANMNRAMMFSYISVAFVLNNSLNWSTENSLSKEIRNGAVVSKIIRPTSFLSQNIADMLGGVIVQGLFYSILIFLIFLLMRKELFIPTAFNFAMFLLSATAGMILRLALNDLFSLLCFFVTGYLGIAWLKNAVINFFSGALIPVTLFPKYLAYINNFLPFKYMIQVPVSIFLGEYNGADIFLSFVFQILWIALFTFMHCAIYRKIRINLVIAGG